VARTRKNRDGGDTDGGDRLAFSRVPFALCRAANDNRLSLKGWAQRILALAVLIGLIALVAWNVAG
jgi:hypothetical protein